MITQNAQFHIILSLSDQNYNINYILRRKQKFKDKSETDISTMYR